MTFSLTYELDYHRLISAVINDARNTIPETTNQPGAVIYAFIQAQIALVPKTGLVYRIVADNGVLAGILALQYQNGAASIIFRFLRPAFQEFETQINDFIISFISNNQFIPDVLY